LPDDNQLERVITLAKELGINLIDTAPAYGDSERRLGRLIRNRHEWLICTKAGEEFEKGRSFFDFSARHIRYSVERSLRLLRTDYLDVVLIHSDGRDEDIIRHTDCLETLSRCREQGWSRAFGMSTKTVHGGLLAARHCDVLMLTYNPGDTEQEPVIERAGELGRGVLIKKALASGHLPAQAGEADPVRASLEFVLQRRRVDSVLVGSIDPAHIRENAAAACAAVREGTPG